MCFTYAERPYAAITGRPPSNTMYVCALHSNILADYRDLGHRQRPNVLSQ